MAEKKKDEEKPDKPGKQVTVRVKTTARLHTRAMGLSGAELYRWEGPQKTLILSEEEWKKLKATMPASAYRVIE